ncbi:flagellar hook-associated protein FlgK [Paraburkholderia dipogonis]|uniref:flagellar hook-associated protein FlgK n=1 Tax=Paraburkholderia dipogonis TaxID=1211383 RepID=UPI0038B95B0A
MTSSLLNIGLSGLNAASWGLQTTGQNISNVATPGYSRVRPIYQETQGHYSPSGYLPQGVSTTTVQRQYSDFLTSALNDAQARGSSLATYYSLAAQLNNLVGSPTAGISTAIPGFFNGLQDLANSPSSLAVRQTVMSKAQVLVDQFHAAGAQYAQLRSSTNTQISGAVSEINGYAKQIAQLNAEIAKASAQGQPPNDLLDRRDLAVSNLSQLVGAQVVSGTNGVSVFMPGGQPLVNGNTSYELGAVASPSEPTELAVAWLGTTGANPKPTPVDLPDSSLTDGVLGGLITFRRETLDPAQAQLGAIAMSLAGQVNQQNALGVDLAGRQGGDLFKLGVPTVYANRNNTSDAQLGVSIVDGVKPPIGDFTLSFDGSSYALTDKATGNVVGTSGTMPATINGMKFELSGAMAAGDAFTVLPTRGVLDSFGLATTDGAAIAAASPVLGNASPTNSGGGKLVVGVTGSDYSIPSSPTSLKFMSSPAPGQLTGFPVGSTVTLDGTPPTTIEITDADTPVPYDPAKGLALMVNSSTAGGMNGVRLDLSGKPANGDLFTVSRNSGATGDGSNALALSNLLKAKDFNGGITLTSGFSNYVNSVGNTTNQLKSAAAAQNAVVQQVGAAQQSVSGVNINEEAANLMYYQQLYQANSKVIQAASTMFDTVLGIFR